MWKFSFGNDLIKFIKSPNKKLIVVFTFEHEKIKNILHNKHKDYDYGIFIKYNQSEILLKNNF